MSRSSSRIPGASIRNSTGGCSPRSGRQMKVSIAPSLVAISTVCSIMGSGPPPMAMAVSRAGEACSFALGARLLPVAAIQKMTEEETMKTRRLRLLAGLLLCAVLMPALGQTAGAQSYPDRPVRLVVPFPAGGPADALGRILGDKLAHRWGQPVVIENRGGAGGNVGANVVARSAPDGYTLLLNASSHVINASLTTGLPYDPIKDFTPISEVASYMLVLVVHPSAPPTTLKEFVQFARSQAGGLTVATAGIGTPTHLAAVLFAQAADLNLVHLPYRGAAPATNDLLAGHVKAMFNNPVNAVPQAKANALRALAVTGCKRLALLPDLPTVAELGYSGYETRTWYGLFGPAGMAPEHVAKVYADAKWALQEPDVIEKLTAQGWDLVGSPPAEFSVVLKSELERWAALIKSAKIKQEN